MRDLVAWRDMTVCKHGMIDVENEVASMPINEKDNISYIRGFLNKNSDGKLNLDGEITYLFSRATMEKLTDSVKPEFGQFMNKCLDNDSNIFYIDVI